MVTSSTKRVSFTQRRRAIAPGKILIATNLRLENTRVYQEAVEEKVRSLLLRLLEDYLVKLFKKVVGIKIAIAGL
ncbi:hypothetical protein [Nostoc sp. PCC 9305]|uniref:hypothetical protein n=1 Tax=Nostoc sp. PCC 9305 TaxID=296636 RepID=UPI0039C600E6